MRASLTLISLALTILLGGARAADACSCMVSGPPCQAFWGADAVLDATVVSITPPARTDRITERDFELRNNAVELDVHHAYKGAGAGPMVVSTYPDGAGCGYDFKVGKRYLIFARPGRDGRLTVSLCSATQEYDGRGPAAEFLASLQAPPKGGRVFGTVKTSARSLATGETSPAPAVVGVRLAGSDGVRATRSTGGRFEFTGLVPGTYSLEVDAPQGYASSYSARQVQIQDSRGCAEENFAFAPAGRITGQLIGPDGRPLGRLAVEVASPEARPHADYGLSTQSTRSDPDGRFELAGLPPGRYLLGVNLRDLPSAFNPYARTVYPGGDQDPHIIELTLGQAVDVGTWYMPPPLPVVRVSGIVVRADGTPVPNVWVSAVDITGNPVERARGAGGAQATAEGHFTLELRRGRVYTFLVRGERSEILRISAPRIETRPEVVGLVKIVVQ